MTGPATPIHLPWHRRLEARVAIAVTLLVAAALSAVLVYTIRLVSAQSRERATAELESARTAFYSLLEARVASASALTVLVTQLPVFRAHLTEALEAADAPGVFTHAILAQFIQNGG